MPDAGLCECGCGGWTSIAPTTATSRGWVKGQPLRFILGHSAKAKSTARPDLLSAPNSDGRCRCGCGEMTARARQSRAARGWVKGEHVAYVVGHQARVAEESRARVGAAVARRKTLAARHADARPVGICSCGCGVETKPGNTYVNSGHAARHRALMATQKITPPEPRACLCGCGGTPPVSPITRTDRGWIRGQRRALMPGHAVPVPSRHGPMRRYAKGQQPRPSIFKPYRRGEIKWEVLPRGGCWIWRCALDGAGYGVAGVSGGRTMQAHRWVYLLHLGAIPDGLTLDHLCENKWCVAPHHMEPVTSGENVRRQRVRRRLAAVRLTAMEGATTA